MKSSSVIPNETYTVYPEQRDPLKKFVCPKHSGSNLDSYALPNLGHNNHFGLDPTDAHCDNCQTIVRTTTIQAYNRRFWILFSIFLIILPIFACFLCCIKSLSDIEHYCKCQKCQKHLGTFNR